MNLIFFIFIESEMLENLVGRSKLYFHRAFRCHAVVEPVGSIFSVAAGIIVKTAATVASRTDIADFGCDAIFIIIVGDDSFHLGVIRHILVIFLMGIIRTRLVNRINLRAVDTLPDTEIRETVVNRRAP